MNSLGDSCFHRKWKIMLLSAPRIQHIGMWWVDEEEEGLTLLHPSHSLSSTPSSGVHKKAACNEAANAAKARALFKKQESFLFPQTMSMDGSLSPFNHPRTMKPFGGWGDPRDHQLCLSFVR